MRNIVKGVYQNSLFKTLVLTLIYRLNLWLGTFDRVDEYIFLTPFSKKLHCDWMPRRFLSSRVKPNFIMEEYTIHDTDKAIDVLFVGRFTPEKGILDVLPTLISKKALKIDLVGDGPEFNAVKDTVKNHNHITLHGSKTRKEVLKLLESTRFLLFPSIWYEGMPVTILEAYAKSVPVISRNLGAMSSMVIDQVTGFHYNSNEHLKEILLTLDTCDYRKLSHGAYHEFNLKYNRQNGLENITQLIYEGNS
jgi:glycosyltransferase involved in cell wall biosynthesis